MQYYALPFTTSNLAKSLHVTASRIQEANTTSMLSRSIGAVIFGIASDQYGRKWPLMANLVFLGVFSLCSGFIQIYGQLIGVRFLFGKQ
jgi:MFS transporter, SHS family, lactate transporter